MSLSSLLINLLSFFLALGLAKIIFSYHILMNIFICIFSEKRNVLTTSVQKNITELQTIFQGKEHVLV